MYKLYGLWKHCANWLSLCCFSAKRSMCVLRDRHRRLKSEVTTVTERAKYEVGSARSARHLCCSALRTDDCKALRRTRTVGQQSAAGCVAKGKKSPTVKRMHGISLNI
jgi:hypothetical protein